MLHYFYNFADERSAALNLSRHTPHDHYSEISSFCMVSHKDNEAECREMDFAPPIGADSIGEDLLLDDDGLAPDDKGRQDFEMLQTGAVEVLKSMGGYAMKVARLTGKLKHAITKAGEWKNRYLTLKDENARLRMECDALKKKCDELTANRPDGTYSNSQLAIVSYAFAKAATGGALPSNKRMADMTQKFTGRTCKDLRNCFTLSNMTTENKRVVADDIRDDFPDVAAIIDRM